MCRVGGTLEGLKLAINRRAAGSLRPDQESVVFGVEWIEHLEDIDGADRVVDRTWVGLACVGGGCCDGDEEEGEEFAEHLDCLLGRVW